MSWWWISPALHFSANTLSPQSGKACSFCLEFKVSVWSPTHVVCERLSAMQEQVRLPEFLAHFANNTNSWLAKNTSLLRKLARSWDFEFCVAKNIPTPTPKSVWRLTAVSHTDTVSFQRCMPAVPWDTRYGTGSAIVSSPLPRRSKRPRPGVTLHQEDI